MARKASRTYKLRLSPHGVDHFLACHYRLAKLVGEFIPYGATLSVAVMLLDRLAADEIAAELEDPPSNRLAGDSVHFVGCSTELVGIVQRVADRLTASDQIEGAPSAGRLYHVGLVAFGAAEDGELADAYAKLSMRKPGRSVIDQRPTRYRRMRHSET